MEDRERTRFMLPILLPILLSWELFAAFDRSSS